MRYFSKMVFNGFLLIKTIYPFKGSECSFKRNKLESKLKRLTLLLVNIKKGIISLILIIKKNLKSHVVIRIIKFWTFSVPTIVFNLNSYYIQNFNINYIL